MSDSSIRQKPLFDPASVPEMADLPVVSLDRQVSADPIGRRAGVVGRSAAAARFLSDLEDRAARVPATNERLAEVVTWWCDEDPFPGDVLSDHLVEEGRATVWVPRQQAAEEASQKLALPSQTLRRAVIGGLGAAGFAVLDDQPDPRFPELQRIVAQRTNLLCRYFRAGDEESILELFTASFGPHRTIDHWRWKFEQNPYRNELISLLESPEGELTTHYGGFGVPVLRVRNGAAESLLAMQMGDTMTRPGFRDVGRRQTALLPRAVRHFFARYRTSDFSFYFGFNQGPIQRFCRWFIGGDRIAPVGYWQRTLPAIDRETGLADSQEERGSVGARSWAGAKGGKPGPTGPDPEAAEPSGRTEHGDERFVVAEETPNHEYDALLERVAPAYGLLVERNERYLRWRYGQCPDHRYVLLAARRRAPGGELLGWAVFRREGDVLLWGDLLLDPAHSGVAHSLLNSALSHPDLGQARRVDAWFSEEPAWSRRMVEALGFERLPHPQGLALVALANPPKFALDELKGLYTTWGDSDLY